MAKYRGRISGPLLDRIDLQVSVPTQPAEALLSASVKEENSTQVRKSVMAAHGIQLSRQGCNNAHLRKNHWRCEHSKGIACRPYASTCIENSLVTHTPLRGLKTEPARRRDRRVPVVFG